jgi:hypothetical protein
MAKKKETKKVVEPLIEKDFEEVETPVMETPKPKKVEPKKPSWEIKDRVYYLKGNKKPLSRLIKSANVYYFDEEKGYERELKVNCQNQKTPFVDEMKGDARRLEHVIFRARKCYLFLKDKVTVLQKLLSLYHPDKDMIIYE